MAHLPGEWGCDVEMSQGQVVQRLIRGASAWGSSLALALSIGLGASPLESTSFTPIDREALSESRDSDARDRGGVDVDDEDDALTPRRVSLSSPGLHAIRGGVGERARQVETVRSRGPPRPAAAAQTADIGAFIQTPQKGDIYKG